MDRHAERIAKEMGYDKKQPIIQFYDHAIPDAKATEQSNRPRFRSAVYIQKIPSAEDLIVRDVFSRKATEQDKKDYPEQWAVYLEKKANLDNGNPPVTGLPGMHIAAVHELRALEIHSCRQFAEYDGDLDDLEPLREIAREVLEIGSRQTIGRNIRERRDAVQNGVVRQPYLSAATGGAGTGINAETGNDINAGTATVSRFTEKESNEKAHQQEKGQQEKDSEEVETFRYAFEVTC